MQNFFKLFSLDETYDIDLAKLDEEYFTLQAMYHPDKTTSLRANEMSAAIHGQAKPAIHAAKHHEKIDCFVGLRPSRNDVDQLRSAISTAFAAKDYHRAALKVLELRFLEK